MVIDFHCHFGKNPKPLNFQKEEDTTAGDIVAAQKRSGIDYSTAIPFSAAYREDLEVANGMMMALRAETLLPFVWLNPYFLRMHDRRGTDEVLLIDLIIKNNVRGIKVHPVCDAYYPTSRLLGPVFEIARETELPLLWHTGWGSFGDARYVEELAEVYGDVQIVIGHMVDQNAPGIAKRFQNVSLETSYCSGPRRLAGIVNMLGSERILFGSDFPAGDLLFQKTLVECAKIPDKDKENILGLNAKRLLNIKS